MKCLFKIKNMRKEFNNGSAHDKRNIDIEINDGIVSFYFSEQYKKQQKWIEYEIENRGEDNLDEDEKGNHEFYWFDLGDWERDKTERLDREDNWHTHMNQKNWFTQEMANFLNDFGKIQ